MMKNIDQLVPQAPNKCVFLQGHNTSLKIVKNNLRIGIILISFKHKTEQRIWKH